MRNPLILCALALGLAVPAVQAQHAAVTMYPGEFRFVIPRPMSHQRGAAEVPSITYSVTEVDNSNSAAGVAYQSLFDVNNTAHGATIRADAVGAMTITLLVTASYPDGNGTTFTLTVDVDVIATPTPLQTDSAAYLMPEISGPLYCPSNGCSL